MTDGWIAIPVYLVFLVISNIMSLPGKYYVVGKDDKTPSKIAYKIAIVKDALLQDTKTGLLKIVPSNDTIILTKWLI